MNRLTLIEKGCVNVSPSETGAGTSGLSPNAKNVYSVPSSNESSPISGRRRFSSNSQRRSSFLNSVREIFHTRSGSLGEKMFRKSDAFRRVQVSECNVDEVYDLRDSKKNIYDDETAFRRPRSNSSDFLILRKTSRPLTVNVVGLIDQQVDPYRQYMKVVAVYELCPQNSQVHAVDHNLSVQKAFGILREKRISSLLVWDSDQQELSSILTLTDFLTGLRRQSTITDESCRVRDILSGNQLVKVDINTKIIDACEEFNQNKLHRIAVCDDLGNVVFMMNIRRVLSAIHKQNRSLHFAQWLSHPVAMSNIGTWNNIKTVSMNTSVLVAMDEMIGFRFSTLPIVDKNGEAQAVITKRDICQILPSECSDPMEWMRSTKLDEIVSKCTRQIFLNSSNTIGATLDSLLNGQCHTAFILHNKRVIGAISLSDILHYLLNPQPFSMAGDSGMPTPESNDSSFENIRSPLAK